MKTREFPPPVLAYRIEARRLFKQLRSDSSDDAVLSAARFRQIRSFASRSVQQILEIREQVKLKHALAVIAFEHGHTSWRALKEFSETVGQPPLRASTPAPGREMYARGLDVLLNRWFASYEDARASLEQHGGFLLPFDRQFFICEPEGIRILGLNPDDPDWERIGWDWVKPLDQEAWLRLKQKREQASQGL
ncbi:MAG: hypothetical protein LC754_01910 [Acidobacteria bacterium]|nr:hypothetical protein [Acidobacteriota bacterium]